MGNNISTYTSDNDTEDFNVGFNAGVDAPQIAGIKAGGDVTSQLTINNTTTDHAAVDSAFDLADATIGSNKAIAGGALDLAGGIAGGALDLAGKTIDAISGESDANRNFAGKVLTVATDANAKALAALADANNKSISALAAEQSASRNALISTFQGSLGTITSFADKSFASIDSAYDTLDNAYETSLKSLSSTVDKVTSSTTSSIAAFADANRSETADSFNKLVKYGLIAATVIVSAIVMNKRG